MYTCGEVELDNEEQGKATPGQLALKKQEEETVEEETGIVYSARQSDSCIDDNIHGDLVPA